MVPKLVKLFSLILLLLLLLLLSLLPPLARNSREEARNELLGAQRCAVRTLDVQASRHTLLMHLKSLLLRDEAEFEANKAFFDVWVRGLVAGVLHQHVVGISLQKSAAKRLD